MATNGKRNRAAGHSYELEIATAFRAAGHSHVVTSRSESRSRDNMKIDLINKNEGKVGRLPYNVQCKNVAGKLQYHKVLGELPKDPGVTNVVLHKQTQWVGTRFVVRDKFAIMYQEDFFELVKELKALQDAVHFYQQKELET
jgi:hypothetical protein